MEKCAHVLKGHTQSVTCLQEDGEGQLISGGLDGIRVWDMTADEPCITGALTYDVVYHMIYEADESRMYVSTDDGIKILGSGCTFDQPCQDMEMYEK